MMKRKFTESLDVLGIVSWVITITLLVVVMYLEKNNISVKWVWNDLSRSYTSDSMIHVIQQHVEILVIMSGTFNITSCLFRHLFTEESNSEEDFVAIEEIEYYEDEEEA